MERKEYLESMGVRAARRAFFSYTTEPEGSYSIHRVFIRFLKVNRMDMGQAEKPKRPLSLQIISCSVSMWRSMSLPDMQKPMRRSWICSAVLKKWKRNSPCLWNGKQRPAMARNESFCRLICGDAMMSTACGRLSNFLTVSPGGMKKGKTRRNGL